ALRPARSPRRDLSKPKVSGHGISGHRNVVAPDHPRAATLRPALAPSAATTQVKILVPGNHLMVGLLGQRDELLRMVEDAFPVSIHVRGNEITVTGEEADADRVGRLFEELVVLLQRGHELDRDNLGRSIEMLKADQRP